MLTGSVPAGFWVRLVSFIHVFIQAGLQKSNGLMLIKATLLTELKKQKKETETDKRSQMCMWDFKRLFKRERVFEYWIGERKVFQRIIERGRKLGRLDNLVYSWNWMWLSQKPYPEVDRKVVKAWEKTGKKESSFSAFVNFSEHQNCESQTSSGEAKEADLSDASRTTPMMKVNQLAYRPSTHDIQEDQKFWAVLGESWNGGRRGHVERTRAETSVSCPARVGVSSATSCCPKTSYCLGILGCPQTRSGEGRLDPKMKSLKRRVGKCLNDIHWDVVQHNYFDVNGEDQLEEGRRHLAPKLYNNWTHNVYGIHAWYSFFWLNPALFWKDTFIFVTGRKFRFYA